MEIKEVDLINKIYALFIDERGLTGDFQRFMDEEAIKIFYSERGNEVIN
jgi:hypothetical protein